MRLVNGRSTSLDSIFSVAGEIRGLLKEIDRDGNGMISAQEWERFGEGHLSTRLKAFRDNFKSSPATDARDDAKKG